MDSIKYPLRRLRQNLNEFVLPCAARSDIGFLRAQIELRGLALGNLAVIRCRLQRFMRSRNDRRRRSPQKSVLARSHVGTGRVRLAHR